MFTRARNWLRRNGTAIVVGIGVIGATYLGGQYVISKLQESRQRSHEERIARDNLKRRFQVNQEDCTYTVLALLPTVRDEIITALPVEQITEQLQQERQERLKRLGASEAASSEFPSASPSVAEDDGKSLGSSGFIHASQVGQSTLSFGSPRGPKRTKAQLWQEMKINSISRVLTLIYTLSFLTLLTRIQLNLLGRRTYLSSVVALASPPAPTHASTISLENRDDDNYDNVYGNDFETNRRYLTFSWWLLHRGSKKIMERVMAAVKDVFGGVNIREDLSLERLSDLIMQVRRQIEGHTEQERRQKKWLEYLLPAREDEVFVIRQSELSEGEEESPSFAGATDPLGSSQLIPEDELINTSLRRLLDETSDLIDSPTFAYVLTRLLDTSFSNLIDVHVATEAYNYPRPSIPSPGEAVPRISEISDTKCKLAHVLPVFCKQAHSVAAGSGEVESLTGAPGEETMANEYLAAVDRVGDLEAFAAVIYSSNFEYEIPEVDSAASSASPYEPPARAQPQQERPSASVSRGVAAVDQSLPRSETLERLVQQAVSFVPEVKSEVASPTVAPHEKVVEETIPQSASLPDELSVATPALPEPAVDEVPAAVAASVSHEASTSAPEPPTLTHLPPQPMVDAADTTVDTASAAQNTLEESTVDESALLESQDLGANTIGQSTISDTTLDHSTFDPSSFHHSTLGQSTLADSTVYHSTLNQQPLEQSTLASSALGESEVLVDLQDNEDVRAALTASDLPDAQFEAVWQQATSPAVERTREEQDDGEEAMVDERALR